jgi:hypothetical protein
MNGIEPLFLVIEFSLSTLLSVADVTAILDDKDNFLIIEVVGVSDFGIPSISEDNSPLPLISAFSED